MSVCNVCGGKEFDVYDGLYFCVECNTQSQVIREQKEEDETQENISARLCIATSKEKKPEKSKDLYGEKWSTHQCFNIIICRQVEKLIELGASPQLKNVVFNLWAKYLQKCEVAFLKNKAGKDWTPRLGTSPASRDIFVLYKNKVKLPNQYDKKKIHTKSNNITEEKKGEVEDQNNDEFIKTSEEIQRELTEEMEVEENTENNRNGNTAVRTRNDLANKSDKNEKNQENDKVSEKKLRYSKQATKNKMLNKNKTPIKGRTKSMKFDDVMSMEKTVAFCYLGLLLTEDCILISDIIRWTREDHFPYISVSYLLPSTMILQTTDWKLITPYKLPTLNRINELTEKMANFLGIKEIPEKLLMPIIARFVIDLNLPLELISFIHKLVSTRIPCMKFKLDGLPRYEVRAMAIIVIALKLLFGLNDKTERQLSSLGRKLEEYKNFGNQFFIWEDWVEHMKIQINFIFHSHIPLALFMENDVYDIDRYNLFYDQIVHSHWRPKSAPCSSRNIKKSFEFYDSLKKVFSSLKDSNEEQLSYPKTSFPYSVLLNYYKELYFKNNSEKKLFHHKTLKYLTNCKDYYEDLEITKIYQDQEFNDLILGSKNAFTQDFPYSQYWIAHFQKHTVPEVPYDSFKWLLSVCSCYIEVSTDDLYREVMQLESFVVKDCPKLKVLPRNYTTTVHELKEKTFGRKIKKPKYRKSRKQHN